VVGCIAQCVPGKTVCAGNGVAVPNTVYGAKDSSAMCDTNGRMGTPAACAANTYCRKDPAGQSLGCVACVGGANEFGLPDTRCGDSGGNAGNTNVFTCLANSSGWDLGGTLACGGSNNLCHRGQNWGVPMSCAVSGGSLVADCCSTHCFADQSPSSAYCGN
jgi:hypothetical protein